MPAELAPRNKAGLSLRLPLIAGSGAVGYADAWPPGVAAELFGAVVTGPVTLRPQRGQTPPRLTEVPGGFALATGDHNPGYHRVLRDHDGLWRRLGAPVIVALGEPRPDDWPRLAEHLEEESAAAGLELALPAGIGRADAAGWVGGVRRSCTLPILAKLPVAQAERLAGTCVEAGADALVIGGAPVVAGRAAGPEGQSAWVTGALGGPAALPHTLRALRAVVTLGLAAPLVAAGGIGGLEDAQRCLGEGATAVQVRSLLWTDPARVLALARSLTPSS